jgi:hypothetical protein
VKQVSITAATAGATSAGITFEHEDGAATAWFKIPNTDPMKPSINVDVRVDGTNLSFFPERSSAQRHILSLLGVQL